MSFNRLQGQPDVEKTHPILAFLPTPTEVIAFEDRVMNWVDQSAFVIVNETLLVQIFGLFLHAQTRLRLGIATTFAVTAP